MEYFVGAVFTFIVMLVSYRLFSAKMPNKIVNRSVHSQSYFYDVVKAAMPIIDMLKGKPKLETQAAKHHEKNIIRVLALGNSAYWIKDNAVYEAEIVDGYIDKESAKVVDMTHIDDVELKKMIYVVEKLTDGSQQ